MNEVYLAYDYKYSECRYTIGVYSTREIAERVVAAVGGDVVACVLDEDLARINAGLVPWSICTDTTGRAVNCERTWPRYLPISRYTLYVFDGRKELGATVWARDEQHARELLNQKREQLLASGLWQATTQTVTMDADL